MESCSSGQARSSGDLPVPDHSSKMTASVGPQSILMVSDFFWPNTGGVENHIYQLSQCLIQRGHKVVVLTHAYGQLSGVRYLTNGLKVYYAPRLAFFRSDTLPTVFGCFALVREVIVREGITLVHGHQAFSTMAHEAVLAARTMGHRVLFTDHSLFGFADASSILVNKVLKFTLADVHHTICVSHTSKENTVLRACVPPHRLSVIPNAVDASLYLPDPSKRADGSITIVALSRLVYRKGVDLLAAILPDLCDLHPAIRVLIGGDGPMRGLLEETIRRHGLGDRVSLLGPVPHHQVRELLVQGHIFINASLTEAFCMAIVEAAAAGLLVVSTRVGGVPEVLPDDMLILADPSPDGLLEAVQIAVQRVGSVEPFQFHEAVGRMYCWHSVAERTERAYARALQDKRDDSMVGRLSRYYKCGRWFGKICCCVAIVAWLHLRWLEWWRPTVTLGRAPDFPNPFSEGQVAGAVGMDPRAARRQQKRAA